MNRRQLLTFSALTTASLTLVGCSSTSPPEPSSSGTAPTGTGGGTSGTGATPSAASAWSPEPQTVPISGAEAVFEVGPVVRSGAVAVLRIAATTSSSSSVSVGSRWGAGQGKVGPGGVVLVDTGQWLAFREMSDQNAGVRFSDSDPLNVYAFFGGVETDSVAVYVPTTGFFVDVPVLDEGDEGAFDPSEPMASVTLDESLAGGITIDTYSESYAGDLDTSQSGAVTTVNVSSDVLFASDSYALSADADSSLQVVADQITAAGSGTLTITGHTDDVDTEEYNQTLSEKRATAVKDRLAQLADLSAWQASVVGKGETEPRMSGTSDEARAANRRVEILIEGSEEQAQQAAVDAGELPQTTGATATGEEGVQVSFHDQPVTVSMPQVVRVAGGFLTGDLHIVAGDKGIGSMLGSYLSTANATFNQRKEDSPSLYAWSAWSLALLAEGNRIYPADYAVDGFHVPLSGVVGGMNLDVDEEIVIPVVWPDTGQDTVTLDLQSASALGANAPDNPFRLTDIPVTDV